MSNLASIVYAQIDTENNIVSVNSSDFLSSLTGWMQIDSGVGDKYHHAQNNYFSKSIVTGKGIYRYKYIDSVVTEKTDAEIEAEESVIIAPETAEEKISALESKLGGDSEVYNVEQQLASIRLALLDIVLNG
jgi:hypothetical protein